MKKKVIPISLIALILCLALPMTAFAQYLSYGWPSKSIPINQYSYNSQWQPNMDAAVSSWNNAGAKITFSKSSSSVNKIYAAQYSDTWYGLNTCWHSGSTVTKFEIKLNSRTIAADATNFGNFVRSVFVHELGHSIWLSDNPNTTSSSIMKYSRNRNTMTSPQTYDINSVKAKY